MVHQVIKDDVELMAKAVEQLYTSNQAACSKVALQMLRRMQSIGDGQAERLRETCVLRVKGIQSLIAQDRGVPAAPRRTLRIAERLMELGEWRRSIYLVFECFVSDGSKPPTTEARGWAKWIVSRVPSDFRTLYTRVAALLMANQCVDKGDTKLALRYYAKVAGDVPAEYRSRQIGSFLPLYTEVYSEIGRAIWPVVGQALLNASSELNERSRLKELTRLFSLIDTTSSQERSRQALRDVAEVARRKGFHSIEVMAKGYLTTTYFHPSLPDEYVHAIEAALMDGHARSGKSARTMLLWGLSLSAKRPAFANVQRVYGQSLARLKRATPHTIVQQLELLAAEMVHNPKRLDNSFKVFKSLFDSGVLDNCDSGVILPAITLAENGYQLYGKDGNHFCLSLVLKFARSQYHNADTTIQEMRSTVRSIVPYLQIQRESNVSATALNHLTLAKIRHDLKYHILFLRKLIQESTSHGTVSGSQVREGVRRMLELFSGNTSKRTVTTLRRDITELVTALATLTETTPVAIVNELDSDDIRLRIDNYGEFSSVLFNVVHNAIVHSAKGSVAEITMRGDQNRVCLRCANEVDRENIVALSRRLNDSSNPTRHATDASLPGSRSHGHGMRVVHNLAKRMGLDMQMHLVENRFTVEIGIPVW